MRAVVAVAAAIGLWAVCISDAHATPTVTVTGSVSLTSVSPSGNFDTAARVHVEYSCVQNDPFDYCGGWFAFVTTAPAGQPCDQNAVRWVGPSEDATATARDYDVSWSEFTAGPSSMTACLYVYADGVDHMVDKTDYAVPAAAPVEPPVGPPVVPPIIDPPADGCANAFKVRPAGTRVAQRRKLPVTVYGGDYGDAQWPGLCASR